MPDGSLTILYSDPLGIYEPAATYSLGSNVRFGRLALSNSAELGQADISTIEVEDPGGIRNIVGLRALMVKETAAPSNNQVVFRGVIQDRVYRRDTERALITGADRLIVMDVADYNWQLGARRFTDADANRPAETPGDRIRWLLSSAAHITLFDYGHVTYPTSPTLEANDYRTQTPLDLLGDCCIEGQYNFWVDYNEAHGKPELFFMDPDSASYTADIAVSNVLSDVDSITTFAPSEDAELRRSPTRLAYGVMVAHPKGWVYERNPAVGTQFGKLDQVAPMQNVKSATRARRLAQKFLAKNDEESDRLTFSLKVPAAQVNDIRHGQLMNVRFSHLPGYEDMTGVRVLKRGVVQEDEGGEDYYRLLIEAVPTDSGVTAPQAPYDGTAWATLIRSATYDGELGYMGSSEVPLDGWEAPPIEGPLELLEHEAPFFSIRATRDVTVRIDGAAQFVGVVGDLTITVNVTVNGSVIGSQTETHSGGLGYWQPDFVIEVHDVELTAGDVVTVTSTQTSGWTNFGVNSTYLRVGRGTIYLGAIGDWVGP